MSFIRGLRSRALHLLLVVLAVTGCENYNENNNEGPSIFVVPTGPSGGTSDSVVSIALNPSNWTLNVGTLAACQGQGRQLIVVGRTATGTNYELSAPAFTWTSSNDAVATVDATGMVRAVSVGVATITATLKTNAMKSATSVITVSSPAYCNAPQTASVDSVSISPTSATIVVGGTQLFVRIIWPSNAPQTGTWTTSNAAVAIVNQNGLVTGVSVGVVQICFVATSGKQACATVTITSAPTGSISVTVNPATFALVLGGQGQTFTSTVSNPGTTSTAVTWSASPAYCVTLSSITSNSVVATASAVCSNVQIRATLVADDTKFGNSNGSTGSGTVTCTFTSNVGMQTNGSITLTRGQTAILTGTCVNQNGVNFIPYWRSSIPTVVSVQGATTVVRIGTVDYPAGPSATIRGNDPGTATITMQAAITDASPVFQRTVTVTP